MVPWGVYQKETQMQDSRSTLTTQPMRKSHIKSEKQLENRPPWVRSKVKHIHTLHGIRDQELHMLEQSDEDHKIRFLQLWKILKRNRNLHKRTRHSEKRTGSFEKERRVLWEIKNIAIKMQIVKRYYGKYLTWLKS